MDLVDRERERQARDEYLVQDVGTALRRCKQDDSQFNRRTLVRTVFACIEAMTYGLKQDCLITLETSAGTLPVSELGPLIALLKEETYSLDGKGEPQGQARFLPTDQNFRFAIR